MKKEHANKIGASLRASKTFHDGLIRRAKKCSDTIKRRTGEDRHFIGLNISKAHWTKNKTAEELKEIKARISLAKTGKKLGPQSEEHKRKIGLTNSISMMGKNAGGYGKHGTFYSEKNKKTFIYRSSYELKAFQRRESMPDVLKYEYETLCIPYYDNFNNLRHTIPDLITWYVDGTVELTEVKPQFKIDLDLDNTNLKLRVMKKYAEENDMRFEVITEREIKTWTS